MPLFAEIPFPGWDPVAVHLGPLAVRWYGLGYLAGFLVAGIALDKLGRDGYIALTKEKVSDLIGWLVLAVILGGRLGYALFYEQRLLTHPLDLVKIWEGGLSFHGGLIGVVAGSWLYGRKQGIAWPRLADALSLAVPFGIFFVRCANFINGELYGRVAAGLPWGIRFPTDPVAFALSPELARGGSLRWHDAFVQLRADGRWASVAAQLPLRHPSQLYEALLEGVLIAAVLWTVYLRQWRTGGRADGRTVGVTARPGAVAGLFLLLYAAARFTVEFVRQPDAQLGAVLGPLSMGQVLSAAVAVGGVALLWRRGEAVKAGL